MSEKIPSFDRPEEYNSRRRVLIAWTAFRFGLGRAAAEDLVSEAEVRWARAKKSAGTPAPRPWLYKVIKRLAIDLARRRRREVEMPVDPETGEAAELHVPATRWDETPEGIEGAVIAPKIEKMLPLFWEDFRSRCTPTQDKIVKYVESDPRFFEHDKSPTLVVRSMRALMFNDCRAMGIEKQHVELVRRVRRKFKLTQSYFDRLMCSMRNHWRDARDVVYSTPPGCPV